MDKPWRTSLTFSVIATLAWAMTVFWLLSEAISFHYRYHQAEADVRAVLTWELNEVVGEENRRYELAQIRVNTLLRLLTTLLDNTQFPEPANGALKYTVFVPYDGVSIDGARVRVMSRMIEAFGNADPDSWRDTFMALPEQGVFFYHPHGLSDSETKQRMQALQSPRYASTTTGNLWGAVFKDDRGHLRSALSAVDPGTGIRLGQLFRVDDLDARLYDYAYILRDADGLYLWSDIGTNEQLLEVLAVLPDCDQSAKQGVDVVMACASLKGPPWLLSAITRNDVVMGQVLSLLGSTAPWTLLAQCLLLLVISLILRHQLGRPLSQIIELIDRQKQLADLSYRLPEGRRDELGRIASAYNTLIKTLNAYHKTLEDKVRIRTCELDAAKRMAERASHRKSEHLTSISHEIRTPLNGIVGALSLLERSPLTEYQQALIGTACQSSDFLLSVINNLLDFSRIEAGQLELAYEQTAILPMLDQVLLTVNLQAQEKHLVLHTLVAADVPRAMSLDGLRVQQILINLVCNAVKFTSQGEVSVSVEVRASMLAIAVRDTGKGILQSSQQDIFKPFIQVQAHDSGSGLGLAIASRLANLMGGEILLESQVRLGSTFTLLVPIRDPDKLLPALSAQLPAPTALHPQLAIWGGEARAGNSPSLDMPELAYLPGKLWQKVRAILREEKQLDEELVCIAPCAWELKVLIVDDIPVNCDILGKMLQELGHQVYSAATGEQALQRGRMHVFDWVLMDICMPEMDGLQATALWRDKASEVLDPETPIVALTANALPSERQRAQAAGVNGYMTKPVSLAQLASKVEQVVALQLSRAIELAPNRKLQRPLLDLDDIELRLKLYKTLETVYQSIEMAWRTHERGCLLKQLHSFKGCAGQGGLDQLYELAQDQEARIRKGKWPSHHDISELRRLVQAADQYRGFSVLNVSPGGSPN